MFPVPRHPFCVLITLEGGGGLQAARECSPVSIELALRPLLSLYDVTFPCLLLNTMFHAEECEDPGPPMHTTLDEIHTIDPPAGHLWGDWMR